LRGRGRAGRQAPPGPTAPGTGFRSPLHHRHVILTLPEQGRGSSRPLGGSWHAAMIKKIHLIWMGSFVPMHDKRPYLQRVFKWKQLNPTFNVWLWYTSKVLGADQKAQMDLLRQRAPEITLMDVSSKVLVGLEDAFAEEAFDKLPNWGAASDILRVAILIKHGGCYFDTDIEPVKPLGSLKPTNGFYVNRVMGAYTNDIFYVSETKHKFFVKYRKLMQDKYGALSAEEWNARRTDKAVKNQSTQDTTGPGALIELLEQMGYVGLERPATSEADPLCFPPDYVKQESSDSSWL
jgi:mannosyltransferase OCH1-like enzyme